MALEGKVDSQQLSTQMKSTSWVRSAISSSALCPARLQEMKSTIPPWSTSPPSTPPCAIQATPQISRFSASFGEHLHWEHMARTPPSPPRSSPHLAVAESTHTGWTHGIPQHRAGGQQCPPEQSHVPWHSTKEPAQMSHPYLNHRLNLGKTETSRLRERSGANQVDHLLTVSHKTPHCCRPSSAFGEEGSRDT